MLPQPRMQPDRGKPDLIFCATGKSGLGHLRRITNIVTALRQLSAGLVIHLISNAKIKGLSEDEATAFTGMHACDRTGMASAAARLGKAPVVVDTAVLPGLENVDAPLCLILRETVSDRLSQFRLQDGRQWDLVCVPNPKDHWLPKAEAIGAKKIAATGWVFRATSQGVSSRPRLVSGERTVLVASGGGGNAETAAWFKEQIDAVLRRARVLSALPIRITQAVGPRLNDNSLLSEADAHVQFGSSLNERFSQFDAVISTVGYNSVLELAQTDVPTLLVPIQRSLDDQNARAQGWALRIGHAHKETDIDASARWLADTLRLGMRREPCNLGENGALRCAQLIQELLIP